MPLDDQYKELPLDEAYLVWLYSQVGSVDVRNRSKTYWKLLRFLYGKEFTWTKKVPRDANRASDGKNLRNRFIEDAGLRRVDTGWLNEACSVLEMMVALSWKMEFDSIGKDQADWFWEMIDNLGLTECTDANPGEDVVLNAIINKVLNREYAPTGRGGLFPLDDPPEDQRGVELFMQSEAYLQERAPI